MTREVRIGGTTLHTAFAVPSGPARDVLTKLDDAGLGAARAAVAARLGDPDPFHVRAALARTPDAKVVGCEGVPVTGDLASAALVRAGPMDPGVAGIFAFAPPGPAVRAIPQDQDGPPWLRWRPTNPSAPRPSRVETWTTDALGDEAIATVRCIGALPGGGVALGSDYGLVTWQRERFAAFPWPKGARREARRVEALASTDSTLHVATSQALYTWDYRGEPRSRKHGADAEEGYDDVLALHATGDRLLVGWRTRLEGGVGPADTLCFASDPNGVVYAGTRHGELHVVDGGGPIRSFVDGKPRPVRHLAWSDGALFVAAAGALHRFDGTRWTTHGGEPGALHVDEEGRLWAVHEGGVHLWWAGALRRVPVTFDRPWSLGSSPGALWVGGVGRVWRIEV
jgi:hypothetical protein